MECSGFLCDFHVQAQDPIALVATATWIVPDATALYRCSSQQQTGDVDNAESTQHEHARNIVFCTMGVV